MLRSLRSIGLSTLLLLASGFAACGDDGVSLGLEGDPCRDSSACSGALVCDGPDEPQACGVAPEEECADDADCLTAGTVCHAIADSCSADGVGSRCGPVCTADSCDVGFRCNAGGACEAIPCDEGTACDPWETCDPTFSGDTAVFSRTAGCRTIECSADAECPDSAVCVNLICQSGTGSCQKNEAVP